MYRLQYPDGFESISMKPSPSGLLLGILLGVLVALIAAGWKSLSAAPGGAGSVTRAPANGHDSPPLWKKAVAVAKRNDRWVARRISEDQRVFDADGELQEKTLSQFAVDGDHRPALEIRVLSSQKNGADNRAAKTAELAKDRAKKKRRGAASGERDEVENPFAPNNQARVRVRALGPDRNAVIAGRPCQAFAFTQTTREGVWDGIAYLNATTGISQRVISTARVATLPAPEDDAFRMKKLRITVDFESEDPLRWRARTVRLNLEMSYRIAPLLTFEGRVRNTYRFSRYERLAGR